MTPSATQVSAGHKVAAEPAAVEGQGQLALGLAAPLELNRLRSRGGRRPTPRGRRLAHRRPASRSRAAAATLGKDLGEEHDLDEPPEVGEVAGPASDLALHLLGADRMNRRKRITTSAHRAPRCSAAPRPTQGTRSWSLAPVAPRTRGLRRRARQAAASGVLVLDEHLVARREKRVWPS